MSQLALFDYNQLDPETRITLKQRADKINERTRRIAQDIWENGREFYEAQQELAKHGYGCFQQWAESETGYSLMTVYRFIRVHLNFDYNNLLQSNWGVSALYLLTNPDTPVPARQEAIERAQNGETITHAAAKEIVNGHNPTAFPDDRRPYTLYPDGRQEFTTLESIQKTKALLDEKKIDYFTCSVCQDMFGNEVWHCPICDSHWPMVYEECKNCHEGKQPNLESLIVPHPDAPGWDAIMLDDLVDFNYKRDSRISVPSDIYTPQGMDACQTPAYALDPLLNYLPEQWIIWEPACGEGLLVEGLYDVGCDQSQVVSSDLLAGKNFFEYEPDNWDCIVTNPPFSLKFRWLERCYQLGKPFSLLLPVETLGTKTAQEMFDQYGVEVIFMDKRINFKMPLKGWEAGGATFPVAWYTWGLGIGRQMTFAKIITDVPA